LAAPATSPIASEPFGFGACGRFLRLWIRTGIAQLEKVSPLPAAVFSELPLTQGGCGDNVELISSSYHPGQLDGCRVKEPPQGRSSDGSVFCSLILVEYLTMTSETQSPTEQPVSTAPSKPSTRKSILALSVFALGLNAAAAAYTLAPSDFALPNVSNLAELLPHLKASDPMPDPVLAALKDIQSTQQQHVASLQENSSSLHQNTALLQQDSTALASLRQSITDERVDVKKIATQLSTLIAKVDSLQNAITPEITSSIPRGRARNRLSGVVRKRMAGQTKPVGAVSVRGAPLSFPATVPVPQG
jgi:hypothetical protein